MNTEVQLAAGIKAAKNGDKVTARDILYTVIDQHPRNEAAWVWLSYVVDSPEDRQVCLENVLVINPQNSYAVKGLNKLHKKATGQKINERVPIPSTSLKIGSILSLEWLPLLLVVAFWSGIGFLFFSISIADALDWTAELATSRTFPNYITTAQLIDFASAIMFFILGLLSANIALAVFRKHKFGYFASIILSLGLSLAGPIAVLILEQPNYLLATFLAVMPAVILFLTLLSQVGFSDDQRLAPKARPNQS